MMSTPIDAAFWYARLNFRENESSASSSGPELDSDAGDAGGSSKLSCGEKMRQLPRTASTPDQHSERSPPRLWSRLIKEPLTHFVVLGALIFAAYALFHPQNSAAERRIEITTSDLARLRETAFKQWGKEPDARQMQDLLQSLVREEVLYRAALAGGLDKDDVIVRRRLAQKMEFLAHEEVRAPTEAELREYFNAHPAQFSQAASVDFEHLYFGGAQSFASVEKAQKARQALLRGVTVKAENFMLPAKLTEQDHAALTRDFGAGFADAVFALTPGVWSGPIQSAHGSHLVRLLQHRPRAPSRFEEVRGKVAAEIVNARVALARDSAYNKLLAHYDVQLPDVQPTAISANSTKP